MPYEASAHEIGLKLLEKNGMYVCASLTDVCAPRTQTGDQIRLQTEGAIAALGVLKSMLSLESCSSRNLPVNNADCHDA